MAREFPIANGKLVTDLDANGHKILNIQGGGEGSGGTTDYNDLDNKPKINNVEVSGRKSAEDYGLATKEQLNAVKETAENKRDKADNTAAADSVQFTEWKFSDGKSYSMSVEPNVPMDDPVTGETVKGDAYYFNLNDYYPGVDPSFQAVALTVDKNPLELKFDIYGGALSIWPNGLSATREHIVITKSGEPYVTPTGVKGLLPSPFHALAPEVTDTTVTLKPVDGAANWVKGTVAAGSSGKRTFRIVARYDVFYMDYEHEDELTVTWAFEFSDKNSEIVSILNGNDVDPTLKIQLTDGVTGVVAESDPPYLSNGDHPLELLKNAILEFFIENIELSEGEFDWESTDLSSESFSAQIYGSTLFDGYEHIFPSFIGAGGHAYSMDSGGTSDSSYAEHTAPTPAAEFSVLLPDSTGPARHVSLALTTDVTAETAVTWEGADEIIEAFPGASKLVPGLNVWDVSEVAPGKFRVDRASNPAQSAPLTLTAPNGRVAELTVGDDLVLEVKEK